MTEGYYGGWPDDETPEQETHTMDNTNAVLAGDDLTGFAWPLRGYAPGGYTSECRACYRRMDGVDKRATECLSCAIAALRQFTQTDALREALDDAAIDEIILIFDRPREAMRAALQALAARGLEIREKNDE